MKALFMDFALRGLSASPFGISPSRHGQRLDNAAPAAIMPRQAGMEPNAQLPGGSPFHLCPASYKTDLFVIENVVLNPNKAPGPVYINDGFRIALNGTFTEQPLFCYNETNTVNVTLDCGSHCAEYGMDEGEGTSFVFDFFRSGWVSQLTHWASGPGHDPYDGTYDNDVCDVKPWQQSTHTLVGWVWPMALRAPTWLNVTFDAVAANGKRIYCITAEVCLRWEDEVENQKWKGSWGDSDCTWPS